MATLNIETYLNEKQMSIILDHTANYISCNKDKITSAGFNSQYGKIQVEAAFVINNGEIHIAHDNTFANGLLAEIFLNGDTLLFDSAVYQQRLQSILDNINGNSQQAAIQAADIFSDQQTLLPVS
jgi:hypothetical protein